MPRRSKISCEGMADGVWGPSVFASEPVGQRQVKLHKNSLSMVKLTLAGNTPVDCHVACLFSSESLAETIGFHGSLRHLSLRGDFQHFLTCPHVRSGYKHNNIVWEAYLFDSGRWIAGCRRRNLPVRQGDVESGCGWP